MAEILAAMMFMAIAIPVIVQAVTVSNRLGEAAQRKRVATQLADRLLIEKVANQDWQMGSQSGEIIQDGLLYRWQMKTADWTEDSMLEVSMQVSYVIQQQSYTIAMTTLVDETQ